MEKDIEEWDAVRRYLVDRVQSARLRYQRLLLAKDEKSAMVEDTELAASKRELEETIKKLKEHEKSSP